MIHDGHLSGWPLLLAWVANGLGWLIGPNMSPLQAILLAATLGYTLHRWWLLRKLKTKADE